MKRLLIILLLLLGAAGVHAQDWERSQSVVTIGGQRYYVHTVKQGETLYGLARLYEVSEQDITKDNPQVADGLKTGDAIKVRVAGQEQELLSPRKHEKIFDVHVVNQGETLYAISRRYEIPVPTIMEDNPGLDPAHLSIGQRINIRKKSKGEATAEDTEREITEYRDAINRVSGSRKYHFVEPGETLFGLSQRYGVSTQEIKTANEMPSDELRAGDIIIIPMPSGSGGVPAGDAGIYPDSLGDIGIGRSRDRVDPELLRVKEFNYPARPLKVALILPLNGGDGEANSQFLDFYRGALLGFERLRSEGVSANVTLYNSSHSEDAVVRIVEDEAFDGTDIVIGPVYKECLFPVIDFAENTGAVVVSPLAVMEPDISPLLYQMAPNTESKYQKIKELLDPELNIVYVQTKHPDAEMDSLLRPSLPEGYTTLNFTGKVSDKPFDRITSRGKNLFVVSCTDELTADQILAAISSLQNNVVARGGRMEITVAGGSRWARFQTRVDKNLFFKLNVCYVTSYQASRTDDNVREFSRKYITSFSALPTLYSYRGYDAVRLFVGSAAAGGDFTQALNSYAGPLLQMPYRFEQQEEYGTYINTEWVLVKYNPDYTIEVK